MAFLAVVIMLSILWYLKAQEIPYRVILWRSLVRVTLIWMGIGLLSWILTS